MDRMNHNDENIPELPPAIRDAARDYNTPPALKPADFDGMWTAIEAKAFRSDIGGRVTDRDTTVRTLTRRWFAPRTMLQIAATLLVGVAIGRYSNRPSNVLADGSVTRRMTDTLTIAEPYGSTTSRYFGQAAALLVELPAEARNGRADAHLTSRAHELLLTTRLLLDSPAANDGRIRNLLEDLELVLAQVVRLPSNGTQGRSELELIRQAVDQRDVLPRLRTAAAEISAGDNE
jgi:hypothetical protein